MAVRFWSLVNLALAECWVLRKPTDIRRKETDPGEFFLIAV